MEMVSNSQISLAAGRLVLLSVTILKVTHDDAACMLAVGNMHIVCGESAPSQTMRKRLVGQAMQDHSRMYTGGALQPANAVMVLCGECNLT